MKINQLTPEFAVRDVEKSISFYCDTLGFKIEYQRPEEGFAFVSLDAAQLMLDQIDKGRTFGADATDRPLGLGLNLQIFVRKAQFAQMLDALKEREHPLYLPPERRSYLRDGVELYQKQFVVADPDGYLLRFAVKLTSEGA